MDSLFEVLRSSTDNDARKAAAAQLRQLQSDQPDHFLQHTYSGIASAELAPALRFFLCTLVLDFVTESWHNAVSKATQERFLALYVDVALSQQLPSALLARKVGLIVATMARRGSRKAQVGGGLPSLLQFVVTRYVAELQSATAAQAHERVCHVLLCVHLLLKELQGSRVGHVFEDTASAMVAPLSGVFAWFAESDAAMLTHYEVCLYLLKCSLRTFGRAVFDAAFCRFLLRVTWRLAEGLGNSSADASAAERRVRLLEYALKITEATVTYFPSRLQELGPDFFVGTPAPLQRSGAVDSSPSSPALSSQPLFPLLSAVSRSSVGDVVSEKAVCRALRLLTTLLSAEDGDPFVAHCLHAFAVSADFPPFLQHLVAAFLADATSAAALAEWAEHPEQVAAELDVDLDDENSPMSCAEQLFLALTGSTGCAACALAVAWTVVNQLLAEGQVGPVTAALHAIGIGYYTMAAEDSSAYLAFLRDRLLPLLEPAALSQTSPFVARRVVWLVGMWCESVADSADRRAVMAALEGVLQHAVQTGNVVLVLVALLSTENFITDNHFSLSDLPATLVMSVLQTIEMLLAAVRSPTTVKRLAGLVHVLVEKGALQENGDTLVRLFLRPTCHIIDGFEAHAARAQASADGADGTGDDDSGDDNALSSLAMLLECLGSSVRHCSSDEAVWSLFPTVVQPCTSPLCAATPWAEDNAWELFLVMAQYSQRSTAAEAAQALLYALQHVERDFGMLPLVFRVVYTLLLLHQDAAEAVVTAPAVEAWAALLRESPSAELCGAVTAVLAAVARLSAGPLRWTLCLTAAQTLLTSADVQADQHSLPLAMVLALSLCSAPTAAAQQHMLAEFHAAVRGGPRGAAGLSTLLENLVLLLDVSPSALVSRALALLLSLLCGSAPPQSVSGEDQAMVQRALEGVAAAAESSRAVQQGGGGAGEGDSEGDDMAETRSPPEMLLEWLGDEDVPATAPHIARVMSAFAPLLA